MSKTTGEHVTVPDLQRKFLDLVDRPDRKDVGDFREHFLAQAAKPHRIGFQRRNLKTAFSANLTRLFPDLIAVDEEGIDGDAPVLMYGAVLDDLTKSHESTKALLPHVRPGDTVTFFEMGFLASTTSWSEALASRDPKQACLGYVFDDRAQYYMSDYETRLDEKLNGDFELTDAERARAERVMRRIVEAKISKYNSQPFFRPDVSPDYARRVLVVDQNFSDASTYYGRASEKEFRAMLKAAIAENPDAEILVKTHPDLNWVKGGKRRGYFDQMTSEGRVRIMRDSVNPFEIFDLVDKVYVGTSGMGLEALLAGKQVVCFGAPCYAGWGLTDDRVTVPHRRRKRDLAELFHAFYIWYTIYHLPEGEVPAQIEDVLDFIEEHRPVRPIPSRVSAEPMVSIIIPVHGVEKYLAECLGSIQRQTLQDFEVILIDDVSPDRSAQIAEQFCARDARFRLIRRKENIGPGFARNQGMDLARGKYVLFIDPDDYMPEKEHLARVVTMAQEDGADMVRYRKRHEQIEDEHGNIEKLRKDRVETYFRDEVRASSIARTPQIAHSRHFWNWLYRRDFLNRHKIRFLTTYREERAFLLQAYMADPVVSISDSNGVVYRIRRDSAVRRAQSMTDVNDQLQNFDQVVRQLQQNDALSPDSPHWWLARFQVSQFLHYLYFGFAWKTADAAGAATEFVDTLAATLERTGMKPEDLIADPSQLSGAHLRAGAYGLLLAATRARRLDLIRAALALEPIPAAQLYGEYLHQPENRTQRDLQQGLNGYARNDRVTPAQAQPLKGPRPRLIIHMGATKTGSTVLQHLLEDNRPELLRKGIWYPEVGLFWQAERPHKQAGHARFVSYALRDDQSLHQHLVNGLAQLGDQVHTIILSSEAFFLNAESAQLASYFRDFDVEMVVYLRRQDEWANSQYAELVAGGAISSTSLSFSQWLATKQIVTCLDYDRMIRSWEQHLPRSSLHIRRYLRQRDVPWDIIEDFAQVTGLPEIRDLPAPSPEKTNEARLSATHVELIRQFNKRPFPSKGAYLGFIESAGTRLMQWRRDRGLDMSAPWFLKEDTAEQIMAAASAGNARIARDYFGVEEVDLFPPRAAPPPECPLYLEEFDIVEQCYDSFRKKSKPSATGRPLVNYGIFGWRLWSSVPLLAAVYRHRGRPDLAEELLSNPAEFARNNWSGRHPKLRWLAYSKGSTMGPRKALRFWVPMLKPLVRQRGGEAAVAQLDNNPVLFVRNLRNPLARLIGRVLFPMGEKC
ncbi:glycosyltransferase [Paracoccus seriniphilus]|uniref:Capsular polysaccharide export protein n=1 Tax=Paracoccus seriniphilus TaxID=184748 RepID=A0A239PYL7_9RHOB|nr:glycosyltransferase [Paracoccus seriniphilus]WCR14144.1 glycosyltransferase [Paracoccus seriniphilus]SNT75052.1 capsular polysaccharide export protein [Paracoccus seriniphilus]